ncbi:MAG: polysaccharide deacetylase family protein [Myxococcota bacterium]|nr:polysaccharide deacetylase family protein [Myxococcota bacterium]
MSVDVDPVDVHLAGYGRQAAPDPLVWERALPRLREALDRAGLRATFFVVARDLPARRQAVRELARAGHEVASHSIHHPAGFAELAPRALREELEGSRARLEDAVGAPVRGFRAPGFALTRRVAAAVREAGYVYDASLHPSPFALAAQLWLALSRRRLRPRPRAPLSLRRRPFRLATASGELVEFPLAVTPGLRLPVYHTARYALGEARFVAALERLARRRDPLSYVLHAVDLLGLVEDGVDARLAGHPGMRRSLEAKRALLAESLAAIAARFAPRPFAARLGEVDGSA